MRIDVPREENALARAIALRRSAGRPIADLTESNPTRVGFQFEEDLILAALASPEGLRYEPDARGLPAAREAVARYAGVAPGEVLLTASTSEAYALLFKLLCDAGDDVLVPEPSYPLFGWLTALESVRTAPYRFRWDGEWHLDFATLAAGPRTRAVLAVDPGNPTGAYLSTEESARLQEACAARGLALILDEVFADFGERPARAPPRALTFRLSGLSKVCGLPQLKLAWCVVQGPGAKDALGRLELIADTYLSVGTPVQAAAKVLLETRHHFQAQVRTRCARNLAALRAARGSGAAWDVLPPQAGWSAVLRVPRSRSEEEWALLLLEAGVLVHPGYFFDFPDDGHLVLSLLPPEPAFAAAAAVLAEVLSRPA